MDIIQGLLLVICFSILPSSVHSFGATLTVDTGSCIETSPGVYLDPGDTVILNCNVTNPSDGFNFLVWNVPIGGAGQLVLSNTNENSINSLFSATRTSVDDDARTVSGQLMFTASETLDEMIVTCSNNDPAIEDTCTLQVTTTPSEPLNLILTRITYDSCELKWNPPSDNGGGGESIIGYSIIGTPDDVSRDPSDTMDTIPDLTPNTIYTFNVSANNSLGFGNPAIIQCNTTGNVPPGFSDVSVCLDVNMTGYTELDIDYSPCPIPITDTDNTPPVDNYTLNIMGLLSVDITPGTCDYTIPVSEDNTYTVEMYVNNIIGSNKTTAPPFITSWLRGVQVKDVTNTSAIIHYTTADCVIPENLTIELNIDVNYSNINPSSVVSYESSTTDNFTVLGLEPNAVVTYTLQVIAEVLNIGMSRTGSFTVISTTTTISSSTTSASTNSMSDSTTPTSTPTTMTPIIEPSQTVTPPSDDGFPIGPVVGGAAGGSVLIIVLSSGTIIIVVVLHKKKKRSGKVNLDGSRQDEEGPIPLVHRKKPLPETGQDPVEHEQAPTGDLYALPEKKGSRRQPPSAPKETPTYQDPDTIKRQQAPTGDLYALPEKKPVYTQVNKENKSQGAMYAELGFHDQRPPTSPTGAPLISPTPHDTTVLYAEVQQQQ